MIRYAWGLVLLTVAVVPLVFAARSLRRRIAPRLQGPVGALAEVVLVLAALVVLSELLGTVHLLRLAPVTVVFAVVGISAWWAMSRRPSQATSDDTVSTDPGLRPQKYGRLESTVAVVATAVLAGDWAARTADAYAHGMTTTDTLWYHLPFAARFVQTGSTTSLHYLDSSSFASYFPANSEMLHSIGILFLGNDFVSPALNLGWMAIVLLAAWCIGRRFGVAPTALTGATVVLVTPGLVATQPGGGYTDVVGMALLLASVALVLHSVQRAYVVPGGTLGIAALASGLALGSKFTLVAPVALLTVGLWFVLRPGERSRGAALWLGLVAVAGSYWYLRNLILVGNPLPSLAGIGPFHLPSPPTGEPTSTVAHFLFDGNIWRSVFLPGLRASLGPAWWAVIIGAAAGTILLAVTGRSRVHRMLALVALGSMLAYLVTPEVLGAPKSPFLFVYNVRYATPGLLLGLTLLPLSPAVASTQRRTLLGCVFVAIIVSTQLDATLWPNGLGSHPFAPALSIDESLLGATIGVVVLAIGLVVTGAVTPALQWSPTALPTIAVAALVLVLGYPFQQYYLQHRYVSPSGGISGDPTLAAWTQTISNSRIAIFGPLEFGQYPYYGRYLTNYVQYVERVLPDGGVAPYPNCVAWRRALHTGHYEFVILTAVSELMWTRSDPGASKVFSEDVKGSTIWTVFKLERGLNLTNCGKTSL